MGFLPFSLPFIGQEVNAINWCRGEIATTTALLRQAHQTIFQESYLTASDDVANGEDSPDQSYPPLSSAFITFNQQIRAHMAYGSLAYHAPYHMLVIDWYLEVSLEDVLWGNLSMNLYKKRIQMIISYAATTALIIFWAFPVVFVGLISNIEGLCVHESWLTLLCTIPPVVLGIIQGILPLVLLAVLMMLLSIVLKLLGHFEGIPTHTGLELSLMTYYFIFQVIVALISYRHSEFGNYHCPSKPSSESQLHCNFVGNVPSSGTNFIPQAQFFFLIVAYH
ncbi:hypothetical protein J3R82DRAFT_2778 [Butyriboletus roseoflavus]|nr:hypothetical protein J3R82DRAFT_2778 [Butyriboletus roseoflavus]